MQELLEILLAEFHHTLPNTENAVHRGIALPQAENMIKVTVGMRRTGKTYFVYQIIRGLLEQGIPLESILYINFEDDRILPMDQQTLGKLLDAFYTLYPENHSRRCYIFLDEIQNIENWPLVVRRYFDSKDLQLYLTGSSAKLLGKEIATSLRGRSLMTEIWPYSFIEYLSIQHLQISTKPFGQKTFDILRQQLLKYFEIGGFPGVQAMPEHEHLATLQTYVDTVIFRDVVERHHITNIALLRYLLNTLLKNFAAEFSVNKFYNDIKSQGYKLSKDTIYNYINYLEDAYLVFSVPVFNESLRYRQTTPKKIYAIDSGLLQANTLNITDNLGKLFENLIYLDLRRKNYKIFYYRTKSGYEIDFVAQSMKGDFQLLQVAWNMEDRATREREERALQEAEAELGIKGKIIDLRSYLKEGIC